MFERQIGFLKNQVAKRLFPTTVDYFESRVNYERDRANYNADIAEVAQESLTTVQLEFENLTYQRLNQASYGDYRYTRRHLIAVIELCANMALKNPITVRTINVQADYVFGQGVDFIADHPYIQEVIDEFTKYDSNQKALFSHSAMRKAEKRRQVYGSIFFALYTNEQTGRVQVRNVNALEISDIIRDPDDVETEWWFERTIRDEHGSIKTIYHPSKRVDKKSGTPLPWEVKNGVDVHPVGDILWNAPIIHNGDNRIGNEKFAMPDLYPQIDWALAYKRFLEDWTSIIRSFARMALKVTGLKGQKQAAAAKSLINTTVNLGAPNEKNPSPVGGSTALLGKDIDVSAVKTAGATTAADAGDPVLNMAGCGVGLPNTFYGDAGKGNFATAKTLDRPTELKMISVQKLWKEIAYDIITYVIDWSALAPDGILRNYGATVERQLDVFTGKAVNVITLPKNGDAEYGIVGEPISRAVDIHFPELLERDVADRVRALVNAFTMFGKPLTDIIPDKRFVALLLLQALNIPHAKRYIPQFLDMWKKNLDVEPGQPSKVAYIIPPPAPTGKGAGAEDPSQGGNVGTGGN